MEDVRWLIEHADDEGRPRSIVQRAMVDELHALRRRAQGKFAQAEKMFFRQASLEQATGEVVARYKAGRFPTNEPAADLCCGVGGDLLALAERGPTFGFERSPALALMARANCRAAGLTVWEERPTPAMDVWVSDSDAGLAPIEGLWGWHVDPDRRPTGRRTVQAEAFEPGLAALESWLRRNPHAAVKLAPATELPEAWADQAELEWISFDRECRQQVAWLGRLSQDHGLRRATCVRRDRTPASFMGRPCAWPESAEGLNGWLVEPDPALLAADLVGPWAAGHGLQPLAPDVAYFTTTTSTADGGMERLAEEGLAAAFQVVEVFPFDMKRLKRELRAREIGCLEIKKRGVAVDPDQVRKGLKLEGQGGAVLVLSPMAGRVKAILARRPAAG